MKKILLFALCLSVMIGASIVMDSQSSMVLAENTVITKTNYPYRNMKADALDALVQKIGKKLVDANEIKNNVTFKLSMKDVPNANTSINDTVTVYKGLIDYCSTPDELASVIAHELGHVCNEHVLKAAKADRNGRVVVKGLQTASLIASPKFPYSGVANLGVKVANDLVQSKYSRNQEFAADFAGIDFMVKAGYDPKASIEIMNKLGENYIDFWQDHPSTDKRVQAMTEYIKKNYPDVLK